MLMAYETEIRQKVKSATRYPMIVIVGIIAAFVIMMTFVVPNFVDMFSQSEAELPLPTQIMIMISNVLQNYWC